jgi:hypothetical protein
VTTETNHAKGGVRSLPRNVWAARLTILFNDISSEMGINILPVFLSDVLGVETVVIGSVEGLAESTKSLLKALSGWLSDVLQGPSG